jgi:hypothetical protein
VKAFSSFASALLSVSALRCVAFAACLLLAACQPSNPPPTPLPTKEKTIDKVTGDVDKAMKEAQEKLDAEDPAKKGY